MKITFQLDTDIPQDLAVARTFAEFLKGEKIDTPAPKTEKPVAAAEKAKAAPEKSVDDDDDDDDVVEAEPIEHGPRAYGTAGDGRKKRNKEEMAIDKKIDNLAEELGVKDIPTEISAEEVLTAFKLRHDAAEDADDDFDIDDNDDDDDAIDDDPMSIEDFRAAVIKSVGKHDADAKSILKRYGNGLSAISESDRRRVVAELKSLD